MSLKNSALLFSVFFLFFMGITGSFALDIPGGDIIRQPSIQGPDGATVDVETARNFGMQILSLAKIIISGFALIYIVLIGVYMILYSDQEENIKKQKRQMLYALMGFLFLNIPTVMFDIFGPGQNRGSIDGIGSWSNYDGGSNFFWNTLGLSGILGDIIAFLRVFIFGVAVIIFTWGAIELILSGGDDEKKKKGRNRLLYGILGLIFLGFVEIWARWVAAPNGSIVQNVTEAAGSLFGIAIFFAAPVAIFFLILGAYYYITSAGEEERAKKGKSIIVNTLIATVILIASLSFIQEIVNFRL